MRPCGADTTKPRASEISSAALGTPPTRSCALNGCENAPPAPSLPSPPSSPIGSRTRTRHSCHAPLPRRATALGAPFGNLLSSPVLPDSIGSLHHLLQSAGINVLLAGGWAVNEHGYSRETRDIDWIACESQKDTVRDLMTSSGFATGSESHLVTRFSPRNPTLPIIDFLWVDPDTYSSLDAEKSFGGRHRSVPVLHLSHLISMKIHALRDHEARKGRDAADIRYLLEANPGVVSDDELRALCTKYGPENAYDLVTSP